MKLNTAHIVGSIMAIIGIVLLGSAILEYSIKIPYFAQEGNHALGLVLLAGGLIIALKISEKEDDYYY